MAATVTEAYASTATIGATEYSLPSNASFTGQAITGGCFQAYINLTNLAAADIFELRLYAKTPASGSQAGVTTWRVSGPVGQPVFVTPMMALVTGWNMTIKKISGTDRSIGWSIVQV